MKTFTLIITASTAAVLLAACSKHEPTISAAKAAPATTAQKHVSSPLDPLLKDVDKAKAVQKTVQEAADKQAKAIKAAGG